MADFTDPNFLQNWNLYDKRWNPYDNTNFSSLNNYGNNSNKGFLDGLNLQGLGDLLGGLGALAGVWQGMQQLNLAEDMFGFQQDAFKRNLANQAQAYNTSLADRQAARIASTGNAGGGGYQSLDTYVSQNRMDDTPV